MVALAWCTAGLEDRDEDDDVVPRQRGLRAFLRRSVTWLLITRIGGLIALYYEVVVDKADRPSVMVVIGAMILGAESLGSIFRGGGNGR